MHRRNDSAGFGRHGRRQVPGAAALVLFLSVAAGCRDGELEENPDAGGQEPGMDASLGGAECDPRGARATAPEVLVGPDGLETELLAFLDSAEVSVDVLMYQLQRQSFVDAFVAAEARGVDVRLVIDGEEWLSNGDESQLTAAGVELKRSWQGFTHAHAKMIVVDGARAVIMSSNMTSSINSARNYGALVTDPADVADAQTLFDADWAGSSVTLDCTRLVVSPVNSQTRVLQHIASAKSTLDLEVMYLTDPQVMSAVEDRIADGVTVRVLLADPSAIDTNTATAQTLTSAGAQVRIFTAEFLHAKLIVADGVALVGSQNMSYTSLARNREVGLVVHEAAPAGVIAAQFEADWAVGETP